jgi:hypothetical protein
MPCSDPIFVHPLLGADDAWSGFRIEFAPGRASLEALSRLRASPQFEAFDKRALWFIPALPDASEAAQTMARSVTVFPPRLSSQDTEALNRLEAALRQAQHTVALVVVPEEQAARHRLVGLPADRRQSRPQPAALHPARHGQSYHGRRHRRAHPQ